MACFTSSCLPPATDTEVKRYWIWCMQPLTIWIRVLGVDVPTFSTKCSQSPRCYKSFARFYTALCFTIHIISHCNIFYIFWMNILPESEKSGYSTTFMWNQFIDYVNYAVVSMGNYLVLLIIIKKRWTVMMESFQRVQFAFNDDYIRIRKLSVLGLTYIILLVRWFQSRRSPFNCNLIRWFSIGCLTFLSRYCE